MTKTVTLTEFEWKALDTFLYILTDNLSSNGCNDLPDELEKIFNLSEAQQITKEFNQYNNESGASDQNCHWPLPDFCLLGILHHKINKQLI